MTEFKCNNCNNIFNKFCDTVEDSINVSCPQCKSHWVELYYRLVEPEPFEPFEPFRVVPHKEPILKPIKYWWTSIPTGTGPSEW